MTFRKLRQKRAEIGFSLTGMLGVITTVGIFVILLAVLAVVSQKLHAQGAICPANQAYNQTTDTCMSTDGNTTSSTPSNKDFNVSGGGMLFYNNISGSMGILGTIIILGIIIGSLLMFFKLRND